MYDNNKHNEIFFSLLSDFFLNMKIDNCSSY